MELADSSMVFGICWLFLGLLEVNQGKLNGALANIFDSRRVFEAVAIHF